MQRVRAAARCGARRDGSATTSTFPSTMVDRIVPATTDADIAEAAAPARRARRRAGRRRAVRPVGDRGPLRAPRVRAGRRPARSSSPTSRRSSSMKLRLLNGSHSTLAYLGFLMGHEFVWQASRDPLLATLVERQMAEEIVPTLAASAGHRPRRLLRRSCMRALSQSGAAAPDAADRDGRLAEAAAAAARHRARPASPPVRRSRICALAVAGWIRYASGTRRAGAAASTCRIRWRETFRAHRAATRAVTRRHRRRLPRSRRACSAPTSWRTTRFARRCAATSSRCSATARR